MGKLLRKVFRMLFPDKRTEIQKVEDAIRRYRAKVEEYEQIWADNGMPCCPHCAFPEMDYWIDKFDRAEAWLKVLKEKDAKKRRSL